MFNPHQLAIDHFADLLQDNYRRAYGVWHAEYANIVSYCARVALENIANSDALYHDVFHTMSVTEVGQEILYGKHLKLGGVSPDEWLNCSVALLCHDIGYVRGILAEDREHEGQYLIDDRGNYFTPPVGATDAALTPWHVYRSQAFVRERFHGVTAIDLDQVCACIERTSFPVPDDEVYRRDNDLPGLVRAADLIGQMADINYLRKGAALYYEFVENGAAEKLSLSNPADLRESYPAFFMSIVRPLIGTALDYLRVTQKGKLWIACLHAHVFTEEHKEAAFGPQRSGLALPPDMG